MPDVPEPRSHRRAADDADHASRPRRATRSASAQGAHRPAPRSSARPRRRSSSASSSSSSLVGEALTFITAGRLGLAVGRRLVPPARAVRHQDAARRHLHRHRHRHGSSPYPLGLGAADLPLRVRPAPGAAGPQADPRDPRRHPERRPRLLRPHASSPRASSRTLFARRQPCSTSPPPASASASSPSRWSPRSSEDAMRSVPASLREASLRPRRPQDHDQRPGRVPGRRLRARGRVHPRRVPGRRRDDGRASSPPGRRRRRCSRSNPLEPGQTMTAAMALAGRGHRPGAGRRPDLPEPVLRRAAAVRHHPAPQPRRRPLRPPGAAGVLSGDCSRLPPSAAGTADEVVRRSSRASASTSRGTRLPGAAARSPC